MIKHFLQTQINKNKWDHCIAKACNSMIYPYSWYLDIVSPGWEALIEGDYKALMPLTYNSKYGIPYLHQPFFTQQLGVFSSTSLAEPEVSAFMDAIPSRFKLIEINLNTGNSIENSEFSIHRNTSYFLSLVSAYSDIIRNYSENTKRNLKKAVKNKLVPKFSGDPKKIISLFRQNRGKNLKTLGEKQYLLLENLIKELMKKEAASILTVETPEGKLSAGAIFTVKDSKAVFLFSGSDKGARDQGAMFSLIDAFISEKAGNVTGLDFNGSNDPNLARFYKGFGSLPQTYLQIRKNTLPAPIRWLKNSKFAIL